VRLIWYFGLYSSKSRGNWPTPIRTSCAASAFEPPVQQLDWEHLIKHAPNGWKEQNALESQEGEAEIIKTCPVDDFAHKKSKAS
jgi:hypothetical protein